MVASDLAQALPETAVGTDRFTVENQWHASDVTAFEAGAPHSGADPLDDQVAFKLGDCADDDDDGAAQRAAGIDLFTEADELDVEPVQLVQHIEEVLHRSCDSIRSPHQDNIELAAAGIPHQITESWPLGLGPGDSVRVFLDDLIATLCSHLAQIVALGLRVLIDAGDPHI